MGPAAHATAAPGSGGWTDGPERYWSFEFRGEPLKQVLETVARVTETDMLYDPDMLEDVVIFQRIHEQPMPRLLSVLLPDTPFDYIVLSSGSVVIVRKVADEPAF
ncbi:MAG: hypothetical protein R6U28_01825, partial [Cyclonatronaceae bacterium]